jgi:hypothetical protein
MSDENNLWECDKKKINKEFSNPVGTLIKDIKVDVERQNVYDCGRKQGALEELEHLLKVLDEDFGMPKYNGEIVIKFMKERLKKLKEKGVEK